MTGSAAWSAPSPDAPAPPVPADSGRAAMNASHSRKLSRRTASPGAVCDLIWDRLLDEAEEAVATEPQFATRFHANVLDHASFEEALVHRLIQRIEHPDMPASVLRYAFRAALAADPSIGLGIRADIQAVLER